MIPISTFASHDFEFYSHILSELFTRSENTSGKSYTKQMKRRYNYASGLKNTILIDQQKSRDVEEMVAPLLLKKTSEESRKSCFMN